MSSIKIKVWDLPLRAFHWLLVFAVLAAYITAKFGGALTDWHGRIGALALGLLVFRITWGFVGSTHARFSNFFPTPTRLLAYLKGHWSAHGHNQHGHNPLGALSVFALLGVLTALVATGLFANDDISFQGPLFNLASKSLSDKLTGWHAFSFNVLLLLVALHLVAITFYFFFKKTNLIKPMVTGSKEASIEASKDFTSHTTGGGKARFVIATTIAVITVWLVFDGIVVEQLTPAQIIPANTSIPSW
jgi:cytochrome b